MISIAPEKIDLFFTLTGRLRRAFRRTSRSEALEPKKRIPPRFTALGVGCAKTGTSSLAAMFQANFRAAHEPEPARMIELILQRHSGTLSESAFEKAVRTTLLPLDLELNSSQLNGYIIGTMLQIFPAAQYILTVRDLYSWVRSLANHQVKRPLAPSSPWGPFRELRFASGRPVYTKEERLLQEQSLYTLDEYFSYWTRHNLAVIDQVPADHLLILPTHVLDENVSTLATFLKVNPDQIQVRRANVGSHQASVMDQMDRTYLLEKAQAYTDDFIQRVGRDRLSRENAQRLAAAVAIPK